MTPTGCALTVGPTHRPGADESRRGRAGHPGRARPRGCWPTSPRRRPPSWRRSSPRRRRRDARLRRAGPAGRARPSGPASWSRRSSGAAIKAAPSPSPSGDWVREAGAPSASSCAPRSAGTARRPPCRRPTTSWSRLARRPGAQLAGHRRRTRRHARAALGRRPAAVRRRPPRPGRPDPRRVGLPGLAVCGAAYDGVGIPAVIALGPPGGGRGRPGRMSGMSTDRTNAARTRELNDTIRYTMWSVFKLARRARRRRPRRRGPRGRGAVRVLGRARTSWCAGSTTSAGCAPTPT